MAQIQIKTKYIILGVLLLILSIFAVGYGLGHKKGRNALKPTIVAQESVINQYITKINDMTVYVSKKEQELTSLQEALRQSELSREEIRKLHLKSLLEVTRLNMRIDTLLKIPHTANVVKDTCLHNQPAILLPFSFTKKDQWMELNGRFDINAKMEVDLKMPINISLFSSFDKSKQQYVVTVSTYNLYLGNTTLNSQRFDAVKDKKYSIGLCAGYGFIPTSKPTLAPFVGVGLTRSLVKF